MINFISNKHYSNRYRDEYWFEKLDNNKYSIEGNLQYWRVGGKEGESGIDKHDYGMIDPSGGPYLEPNGFAIDGKKVIRIFALLDTFGFETEN